MKKRRLLTMSASLLAFAASSVSAQNTIPAAKPPSKAAAKQYVAPRTPWGDPDLQGNYTNLPEAGTPLERPEQFAGRKLGDITQDELRKIKLASQENTIQRFETPFDAPSNWWQPAYRLEKGAQAWMVVDPEDGQVPPTTPEAARRAAAQREARIAAGRQRGQADSYEDRSLYDRCITRGYPTSMMPTIYGNSHRIIQGQGFVAIQIEMIHETRVIPIDRDQRPHVGKGIHLDMGDPRGHWEGDTLVVETTNFNPRSVYRNADPDTLKLVERFTKISPTQVRWSVTVEDPKTWTRPWTFSLPLTVNDGEPIMQYECHEGNYGLRNILSAARAEEAKVK